MHLFTNVTLYFWNQQKLQLQLQFCCTVLYSVHLRTFIRKKKNSDLRKGSLRTFGNFKTHNREKGLENALSADSRSGKIDCPYCAV